MVGSNSAMEAKATRFVETFATTIFERWARSNEKELFWKDAGFLQNLLEEAAAKLPKIPLKGHLLRELATCVQQLQHLLQKHYVAHHQQQAGADKTDSAATSLLNEEDVERALTLGDANDQQRTRAILCLDDHTEALKEPISTKTDHVARIEQLVQLFHTIRARQYEDQTLHQQKLAATLRGIASCVELALQAWRADSQGNWDCSDLDGKHAQKLKAIVGRLQDLVVADVAGESTSASWSSFYHPDAGAAFKDADYEAEMAKIYGALVVLAVDFPLFDDESDDEAASSENDNDDDSDDDTNANPASSSDKSSTKKKEVLGVALAKKTLQQVVFAAKRREDQHAATSFLLSALAFIHALTKPQSYRDADGDSSFDSDDKAVLNACLGDLYSKTFAMVDVAGEFDDGDFLRMVLCLRYALKFTREQLRRSVPVISTALTKLATVSLPASFWQWAAEIKRSYIKATEQTLRDVVKQLWKNKATKMANVLINDSVITLSTLELIIKDHQAFVQRVKNGSNGINVQQPVQVDAEKADESEAASAVAAPGDNLFFVDSTGGTEQTKASKAAAKKEKTAKKQAAPQGEKRKQDEITTSTASAPAKKSKKSRKPKA